MIWHSAPPGARSSNKLTCEERSNKMTTLTCSYFCCFLSEDQNSQAVWSMEDCWHAFQMHPVCVLWWEKWVITGSFSLPPPLLLSFTKIYKALSFPLIWRTCGSRLFFPSLFLTSWNWSMIHVREDRVLLLGGSACVYCRIDKEWNTILVGVLALWCALIRITCLSTNQKVIAHLPTVL